MLNIIFVWGVMWGSAPAQAAEVHPYILELAEKIETQYENFDCAQKSCHGQSFLNEVFGFTRPPADKSLLETPAREGVDPALEWLIYETLIRDLKFDFKKPENLKFVAELQLRAFNAYQFRRAWEIGQTVQNSKVPENIYRVQIELLISRLQIFFGQEQIAYKHILNLLGSESFRSSEMITSEFYQSERRWAWYLLYKATRLQSPTQQVVELIAKPYFKGGVIAHPKDAPILELLSFNSTLKKRLRFDDELNSVFWKAIYANSRDFKLKSALRGFEKRIKIEGMDPIIFKEARESEPAFTSRQ